MGAIEAENWQHKGRRKQCQLNDLEGFESMCTLAVARVGVGFGIREKKEKRTVGGAVQHSEVLESGHCAGHVLCAGFGEDKDAECPSAIWQRQCDIVCFQCLFYQLRSIRSVQVVWQKKSGMVDAGSQAPRRVTGTVCIGSIGVFAVKSAWTRDVQDERRLKLEQKAIVGLSELSELLLLLLLLK
jgi:hypothetical protein